VVPVGCLETSATSFSFHTTVSLTGAFTRTAYVHHIERFLSCLCTKIISSCCAMMQDHLLAMADMNPLEVIFTLQQISRVLLSAKTGKTGLFDTVSAHLPRSSRSLKPLSTGAQAHHQISSKQTSPTCIHRFHRSIWSARSRAPSPKWQECAWATSPTISGASRNRQACTTKRIHHSLSVGAEYLSQAQPCT
jgi:hypothetical protein